MNTVDIVKQVVAARAVKDAADARKKEAQAAYEDAVLKMHEAFTNDGVKTMTVEIDGVEKRVNASHKLYASIKNENKEEAYGWLKKEGYDIVIPTINASTLSSTVRSILSENKEVPQVISYYNKPSVSITTVAKE